VEEEHGRAVLGTGHDRVQGDVADVDVPALGADVEADARRGESRGRRR
jgi:hypothetical protein